MRSLRLVLSVAAVLALGPHGAEAGSAQRPIVVELYTSQGCSSCPPADALLGRLAQRPNLIALSLPITYWDMLGWKDTLASDANTRRQKAYAAAMGHGGVYTPQIIVDGVIDVVGSRVANVDAAIAMRQAQLAEAQAMVVARGDAARYAAEAVRAQAVAADAAQPVAARSASALLPAPLPQPPASPHTDPLVSVAMRQTLQDLLIDIGAAPGARDATVWLFHLRSQVSVKIPSGENEGHTIVYHNVVGGLRAIGTYKGRALAITVPRAAMANLPHDGIAVVVQQGGYGHVIGAAYISRPDYYASQ
ncbi:MAG: DUF1223 domain-containing protein [Rhizomicrobium sp.]